jgi:hypothetical protein
MVSFKIMANRNKFAMAPLMPGKGIQEQDAIHGCIAPRRCAWQVIIINLSSFPLGRLGAPVLLIV